MPLDHIESLLLFKWKDGIDGKKTLNQIWKCYLSTESFVSAQHAHMGQFEAPALPQPTFEQPAMTQGNTHAHPSVNILVLD